MHRIDFTLRSPTCVAQRPTAPGQPTDSLRYLTGTVVRAAVASLFLRGRRYTAAELSNDERVQFAHLFLSGDIHFGNAWPQRTEERSGSAQIVPRTAWSHKRNGGWRGDTDPAVSGVRDALADLMRDGGETLTDQGFDRIEHEFAWVNGSLWKKIDVARRLISRAALARNEPSLPPTPRNTAADGQLYSFEAIETGQVFSAPLTGKPERLAELRALLPRPALVSVGQGRSRGLGQLTAQMIRLPDSPVRDRQRLAQQVHAFTLRAGGAPDQYVYLPVTLLADTILRDHYLLPCSSGDPQMTLARYSATPPPQAMQLHYAVQSTRWLGGWDELRRIPRPAQLAVQQGSVWVYRVPADQVSTALAWWLAIEEAGIGERRIEGFGRVTLLHPFHAEEALR